MLVIGHFREEGFEILASRANVTYRYVRECDEDELLSLVAGVHGIAVRGASISERVIAAAPNLEVVARHGVGYDNVAVDRLTERGIPLALAVNANAVSVAEHTMYFLLALAKQGARYEEATRRGDFFFRNSYAAHDVAGRTLLLIGFGRIGSRVARRALAFEMRVLVYDPYINQARIEDSGCEPVKRLDDGLALSDVISVHCPLTEETRGLIGPAAFKRIPTHALLINCARGGIVDEEALRKALLRHEIAGAALDVFESEPPDASNRLFELNNVLVTPHSAGVSAEAALRMSTETLSHVLAGFDGTLSPDAVVNPQVL